EKSKSIAPRPWLGSRTKACSITSPSARGLAMVSHLAEYQRKYPDHIVAPKSFPLTAFDQIKMNAEERNYIVKGLLPRSGLAVVWGPPKSGKSFWCMDLLLHAALGWEYRGRKVQQANVVYVALEGRNGIPARVEAFKIRHELARAPFYLITHPINLVADADSLITSIRAHSVMPAVVCLDTLN